MALRKIALIGLAAPMLMIGVAVYAGDAKPPSRAVLGFERFLAASSPVCLTEPSARCVDIGWRFADTDHDGTLSLAEVTAVRATIQDWLAWKGDALPARDRTNVTLGLIVFDMIGAKKLFAGFNTSGSGKLTRKELLADVKLDGRPLGQVLSDPKSVDRRAIAAKLGHAAPVVSGMMDGKDSAPAEPEAQARAPKP